jgi:hypothetical protein
MSLGRYRLGVGVWSRSLIKSTTLIDLLWRSCW